MSNNNHLTALLEGFTKSGPVGCSLLVARDGETLYEHHAGYADLGDERPIGPDTIYRIYSMSKVVTCVAALMLYERGVYLLNDPLYAYLPEFKDAQVYRESPDGSAEATPAASPILVKDLFKMTSGITYPGGDNETQRHTTRAVEALQKQQEQGGEALTAQSLSKALAAVPLAFDPGTRWQYGFSHDVLGALIEVLSGKRFSTFLDEEVFQPLGMTDTFFRIPDEKRSRLCTLYRRADDGGLAKNSDASLDVNYQPGALFESGGAGLLSTLSDYSRFAQMLAAGGTFDSARILGRNTIDLMASQHLGPEQQRDYNWEWQRGYGFGLGVRVMQDRALGGSNSPVGEFGWSGLAGTWLSVDPSSGLSAVYMQQMFPSDEHISQPRLRSAVYGLV